MKIKLYITALLIILCLSGCARNNVNNENVAYRNKNGMEPTTTRIDYNTPNRVPRGTNLNDLNRNDLQNARNNNNVITNETNQTSTMRVADKAAKKVADMAEVDTANVIVTNNNAFAAVKLSSGQNLTNKVEKKISKRIKSVDNRIKRVYVSANPDFFNHLQDYANDIRAGKPVSGFFTEFSQTIQRVFPNAK